MGRGLKRPDWRVPLLSLFLPAEEIATEIIEVFRLLFRPEGLTKQFSCATKPFSVSAQMSGNSRLVSGSERDGAHCRPRTTGDKSDANHQLHPRLRIYPGWSFDGWFF